MTTSTQRPTLLSRTDVRQRLDRPTRSLVLEYTGRKLKFDEYLYGFPEGAFFAVELADVCFPEDVEAMAVRAGLSVDTLPDGPPLRRAVAEAVMAGAMVDAPALLAQMASPRVEWSVGDRLDLERRHRIAESRVRGQALVVKNEINLRALALRRPSSPVPTCEDPVCEPAAVPGPAQAPTVAASSEPEEPEEFEEETLVVGSQTVARVRDAVRAAREAELPQRLPGGSRRRLMKMPPAVYLAYGEVLDARGDFCAALTDARTLSRKNREVTVIDHDGEWPVVVRRFGQDGRTIYRVETALRRSGVEVAHAEVGS